MNRGRRAISPVLGTIILIAVVIAVGTATWAYANSAVGSQLQVQGEQVAKDVNTIKEKLTIVHLANTSSTMSIWVYNNGGVATSVRKVFVSDSSSFVDPVPGFTPVALSIGELKKIDVNVPIGATWSTIHVKLLGENANIFIYFQSVS